MKKPILLALFVLGAMQAWQNFMPGSNPPQPLSETPYVAVYGRDSCGVTQKMRRSLEHQGIDYDYFIVDKTDVAELLHGRMQQSGLDTRRYNLPVVDVSGKMMIRPSSDKVVALRRSQ